MIQRILNPKLNLQGEDDFSRDAAEGFQLFPGNEKKTFRIRINLKVLIVKAVWIALSLPIKAIAITTMVVAATTGIVFINTIRPSNQLSKHKYTEAGKTINQTDKSITEQSPKQNETFEIHTENSIHYYNINICNAFIDDIASLRTITPNSLEINELLPTNIPYSSFPVIYFGSNKFYDFSSLYGNRNSLLVPTLSGLEAKYEDRNAAELHTSAFVADTIAYLDFLEKISLTIETNQLKEALRLTDVLLNQRPDDENGMYYKGLVLYRLGRYKTASTFFNHCEHSPFRTFYHESRLHRLYILNQSADFEEALKLIDNMMNEHCPYAKIVLKIKSEILKAQSP